MVYVQYVVGTVILLTLIVCFIVDLVAFADWCMRRYK